MKIVSSLLVIAAVSSGSLAQKISTNPVGAFTATTVAPVVKTTAAGAVAPVTDAVGQQTQQPTQSNTPTAGVSVGYPIVQDSDGWQFLLIGPQYKVGANGMWYLRSNNSINGVPGLQPSTNDIANSNPNALPGTGSSSSGLQGWQKTAVIAGSVVGVIVLFGLFSFIYVKSKRSDDDHQLDELKNEGPAPIPETAASAEPEAEEKPLVTPGNNGYGLPVPQQGAAPYGTQQPQQGYYNSSAYPQQQPAYNSAYQGYQAPVPAPAAYQQPGYAASSAGGYAPSVVGGYAGSAAGGYAGSAAGGYAGSAAGGAYGGQPAYQPGYASPSPSAQQGYAQQGYYNGQQQQQQQPQGGYSQGRY